MFESIKTSPVSTIAIVVIVCLALFVIAIIIGAIREARANREQSYQEGIDSSERQRIKETISSKRSLLDQLYDETVERVGHEHNVPEYNIYCAGQYLELDDEEYSYDSEALRAVEKYVEDYQEALQKWERRQLQIQADRETYRDRYETLRNRIEALDGSLKLQDWQVVAKLPKKRKSGKCELQLKYSDYDYCLLCDRLAEIEELYEKRKARVYGSTNTSSRSVRLHDLTS